ncbi:MAG: site-specific DNA-methyltransferase [Terriglobales bacterium]
MATAATPRTEDICVLQGDAFDLFRQVPPDTVDLVITSPPYWGHREYGLGHNWKFFNHIPSVRRIGPVSPGYEWYRGNGGVLGLEPYPEWYITHLAEVLDKAALCLKRGGSVWVNIGDTYFARWSSVRDAGRQGLSDDGRYRRKTPLGDSRQEKQLLLIPARFAIEMQRRGWIVRNDVIWYKPNVTPRPEGDRLKLSHEHLFHFVRKPKLGRPKYFFAPQYAEDRHNDVVIVNAAPGENGHSATFPRELVRPRILTCSPEGGTVLDPFFGTGRALEVALEEGRQVIGFELQKKFAESARLKLTCQRRTRKRS